MKTFKQFIYNSILLEGRTIDEVVVKDQNNKNVNVAYYCYDKESLDKVTKQYESVGVKYWIDKGFFITTLKNKSTWVVNTDKEFKVNTWQPNGDYFYNEDENESYTRAEIIDLLEAGETMVIVINK